MPELSRGKPFKQKWGNILRDVVERVSLVRKKPSEQLTRQRGGRRAVRSHERTEPSRHECSQQHHPSMLGRSARKAFMFLRRGLRLPVRGGGGDPGFHQIRRDQRGTEREKALAVAPDDLQERQR